MSQTVTTTKSRRAAFYFYLSLANLICYAFYLYSIVTVFVSSFMRNGTGNLNSPRFLDMSHIFDNFTVTFSKIIPFSKEALTNSIMAGNSRCACSGSFGSTGCVSTLKETERWKLVRNIYIIPSRSFQCGYGLEFLYRFIIPEVWDCHKSC